MPVLVDSNILLRSIQPHHPQFLAVEHAFSTLRAKNESLCVCLQNFVEFWAVATRPSGPGNGLGLTPAAAKKELDGLADLFPIIPESDAIAGEWRQLVDLYQVSGKNPHD